MKNQVVLSISILMSGRKETRKCLESIKDLLTMIPSELIIIDTGCDKATKDIIQEYTDIIIPFTWCKDFAKARNVGLDNATGEWFMFMDDDEWFEDTSEIIEFFKTGEYKNYNSASYYVRNYNDYDGKKYVDGQVSRLIKIDLDVRFVGKVHEYLYPCNVPLKIFSSYVHHYGYVYKTDEELIKHTRRNIELLEDLLLEDGNNLRWSVQILPEYICVGEYRKAVEFAKDKIEKSNLRENEARNKRYLGGIYGFMMKSYMLLYEYDNVIETTDDLVKEDKISELAKAFIHKCREIAFFELKEYSKSIDEYNKYIYNYKEFYNDKMKTCLQGGLLIESTYSDENVQEAILYAIKAAIEMNRFDLVEKYLSKYDVEERLIEYLQNLENRYHKMEKKKENSLDDNYNKQEHEKLESIFDNIVKVFSKIDNDNWYFAYLKILNKDINNTIEEMYDLYEELFDKIADIFSLDKKIWNIVQKYNIDMDSLIINIDYDKWQAGVNHWCNNAKEDELIYIQNIVNKWNISNNIRYEYLNMMILEKNMLSNRVLDLEFEDLEKIIVEYINVNVNYYKKIYKESVFSDMFDILPMTCRFSIDMLDIISTRKDNGKKVLEKLKNMIDKYGLFVNVINRYSKLLGKNIIDQNKEADKAKDEMFELAILLKIKAREYIENGNVEQARVILQNVIQNIPGDEEAKEILMMIEE